MLNFRLYQSGSRPSAYFETEPDPRRWLLSCFLDDFDRQEELVLGEIAKAEAGETILDLYNNHIDAQLYPDGRVIIESLRHVADEDDRAPLARTEITLKEARQLILDWLEAKKRWYAEQDETK